MDVEVGLRGWGIENGWKRTRCPLHPKAALLHYFLTFSVMILCIVLRMERPILPHKNNSHGGHGKSRKQ